jgi:1,2-diacylglycerol 3-beta-galactosyltransferase
MKRILILMADYGYGHHSAANAVSEALKETHGQDCVVEIVNPLDDERAPAFLRNEQVNYDNIIREIPDLYKLGYQVSDSPVASNLIEGAMTLLLFNLLRDVVRQHQPDVIVCTYPLYPAILSTIFSVENRPIPLITIVTDLVTVHNLWFYPRADLCLVPTKIVYDMAVEAGLPPEKVKITGIPVHPDLAKGKRDLASIRLNLGWDPDLFTVLAVGSKRVESLYESLDILNHSGLPLQLAVVAGGDDDLYQRFREVVWHREAHLYNFVTDMATLMRAADCVLGKAGGLTVTESLACGLPLLLINVIPGQETGNADYIVSGNAGDLARDPLEVLKTMCHWLDKGSKLYKARSKNAQRLGRPQAAYEIAELVWVAATVPIKFSISSDTMPASQLEYSDG